jgi:uncharacterized protein YukE
MGYSHRELYDMVMAGSPDAVEGYAVNWSSLIRIADRFAGDLDETLGRLRPVWQGSAADAYQVRLAEISAYARGVSDDAVSVRTAMTEMAAELRTAKSQLESPEEFDDHDKAAKGAAVGAVLGPGGALAGSVVGMVQDNREKEAARQRAQALVDRLSQRYEELGTRMVAPGPEPLRPAGGGTRVEPLGGAGASGLSAAPRIGAGSVRRSRSARAAPASALAAPSTHGGVGGPVTGGPGHGDTPWPMGGSPAVGSTGTVPVGGGDQTGALAGTSLAGVSESSGLGSGEDGTDGAAPLSAPVATGLGFAGLRAVRKHRSGAAGFLPGGAGLGQPPVTGLSGSGPEAVLRPGTAASGMPAGAELAGRQPARGASVVGSVPGDRGVLGGRSDRGDTDAPERMTWLTEDDMVWGIDPDEPDDPTTIGGADGPRPAG